MMTDDEIIYTAMEMLGCTRLVAKNYIAFARAIAAAERTKAFKDALDCMEDVQAKDHLARCLQDKFGAWYAIRARSET